MVEMERKINRDVDRNREREEIQEDDERVKIFSPDCER